MNYFLITVDTEADNQWAREKTLKTENVNFIPRFQEMCNNYGFYPTYLTTYEVAESMNFCRNMKPFIDNELAEIGSHLHPQE